VGEQAALAHLEVFGKTADGEAFEAFDAGKVHRVVEDGFARAKSASLRLLRRARLRMWLRLWLRVRLWLCLGVWLRLAAGS